MKMAKYDIGVESAAESNVPVDRDSLLTKRFKYKGVTEHVRAC